MKPEPPTELPTTPQEDIQVDIEGQARRAYRSVQGNFVVTESWRNQLVLLAVLIFGTALLIYLTADYPEMFVQRIEFGELVLPLPLFPIYALALLALLLHRLLNECFVLAPDYLLYIEGRLSWRRRTIRLYYQDIREIEIDQTLAQRVVNTGNVTVTPLAVGVERTLVVDGVKNPRLLKDLLLARREDMATKRARINASAQS
ncbi:MAG: hypothetical protein KDD69_20025 [Bdellovibrionales bacterium]|nr:hypothetical protein [Bdellovibrionales bacterium]